MTAVMLTDDLLMRQAKAGDHEAFGEIAQRYQARLLRQAVHLLGELTEAEDAVQESLLKAFRALRRTDDNLRLAAWLGQIVRNTCLDLLRRRQRMRFQPWDAPRHEPVLERESLDLAPEDRVLQGLTATLVRQILAGLPERDRTALLLLEVEGRSCAEIGAQLGMTSTAVKSMLHRARQRARRIARERQDPDLQLLADWASGWRQAELAARHGCSESAISHRLARVRRRYQAPGGGRLRAPTVAWLQARGLGALLRARLTAREQRVLARRRAGWTIAAIAAADGVSRPTVCAIVRRARQWGLPTAPPQLTVKQHTALGLWAAGLTLHAVAGRLGVTETVAWHRIRAARRRAGVETRAAAAAWLAAHPETRPSLNTGGTTGPMTEEDWAVLRRTATGWTQAQIGAHFGRDKGWAGGVQARIRRRLGVRTRAEAVAWYRAQADEVAA